jgi:hypothetical protein
MKIKINLLKEIQIPPKMMMKKKKLLKKRTKLSLLKKAGKVKANLLMRLLRSQR